MRFLKGRSVFAVLVMILVALLLQSQQQRTSTSSFTIPDRGAVSLTSQGGGGGVVVGYTRIQTSSGPAPSGVAIFDVRQNNVLVSEAGVPATPLVSSGRIYAEVGGAVNTGIAIANPNGQSAVIDFYFTDSNGSNFGTGSFPLAANSQTAKFLNESPFNSGSPVRGTFTFTSTVPVSAIALRGFTNERSEFLITTLPVSPLGSTGQATLMFPHFAAGGGWTTQLILVNPTDSVLSGVANFFEQGTPASQAQLTTVTLDGTAQTGVSFDLPARSSRRYQVTGSAATKVGSVRLSPASGSTTVPSGVLVFSFKNGANTVAEAGVPALGAGGVFRLYAEMSGKNGDIGSIQTGVAIVNANVSEAAVVSFDLTDLNGRSTGLSGRVTVGSRGQTAMFLNQIQGFESLQAPFQGVLRVSTSASQGVSVLGLRGRYNERGDFLITTTPPFNESTASSTADLFFPHIVDAGGYSTQFVLFSGISGQSSSGSLRFLNQSGQALELALGTTSTPAPPPTPSTPSMCSVAGATLASGVNKPNVVAIDSDFVYWGDESGRVQRVSKSGGGATLLASVGDPVGGVAVDDTTLYFGVNKISGGGFVAGSGTIRAVPKAGGSASIVAQNLNSVSEVKMDTTHVYWVAIGTQLPTGLFNPDGMIQRIPKSGGSVQNLAAGISTPIGLALDDANVYFGNNYFFGGGTNQMLRVSKSGGATAVVESGKPAYAMSLSGDYVYFVGGFEGGIYRAPKNGGGVDKTYASGLIFPDWIEVADGKIYIVVDGNCGGTGSVQSIDIAGGATTILKSNLNCPYASAVDTCAIYTPLKNGGTIERIPR